MPSVKDSHYPIKIIVKKLPINLALAHQLLVAVTWSSFLKKIHVLEGWCCCCNRLQWRQLTVFDGLRVAQPPQQEDEAWMRRRIEELQHERDACYERQQQQQQQQQQQEQQQQQQ